MEAGKRLAEDQPLSPSDNAKRRQLEGGTEASSVRLTADQIRDCHEENIHLCGAVQTFGALAVVKDARDKQLICFASDNAADIFRCDKRLLDSGKMPVEHLLGDELSADVTSFYLSPRPFIVRNTSDVHLSMHKLGDFVVIEAERKMPENNLESLVLGDLLANIVYMLHNCTTLIDACGVITRSLKQASGFSRVMVYKFHPDNHGEVIAEACDPDLEPFLHLHYPASDIPEQARRLYERNWFRILNASGEKSPIRPLGDQVPESLDLTMARYRACSPVHIKYLENMGVKGSMSLSLIVNNKLWGLIACHDYKEFKHVPLPTAVMYEVLARSLSLQISTIEQEELRRALLANNQTLGEIMNSPDADLPERIPRHAEKLMKAFRASGCVIARAPSQILSAHGLVPPEEHLTKLVAWLPVMCTSRRPVLRTDALPHLYPDAQHFVSVGSGLLAARMTMGHFILLFRPELVRTIRWSGKPEKVVAVDADGSKYFGPRRSFALYLDKVKGQSEPWTNEEEAQARQLSYALVERQQKVYKMHMDRDAARAAIAAQATFLSTISRELQSPMQGIMSFLGLLSETRLSREQISYLSTLTDCSDHLLNLAGDMLDYSRHCEKFIVLQNKNFDVMQACREVVDDVERRYTKDACPPIAVSLKEDAARDSSSVVNGDIERFKQVVKHLLTNAVAATDKSGKVHMNSLAYSPTNQIEITVSLIASSLYPGRVSVSIDVEDTGCGIAEEDIPNIFTSFAPPLQNHQPSPGQQLGRLGPGMGLSIARKLAVSMDGDITVKSVYGAGSTFTFTCVLERHNAPSQAQRPGDAEAAGGAQENMNA